MSKLRLPFRLRPHCYWTCETAQGECSHFGSVQVFVLLMPIGGRTIHQVDILSFTVVHLLIVLATLLLAQFVAGGD
jgi:hypothetical protein